MIMHEREYLCRIWKLDIYASQCIFMHEWDILTVLVPLPLFGKAWGVLITRPYNSQNFMDLVYPLL